MTRESSDVILERMMALHPKIIDLTLDRMWRCLHAVGDPHLTVPPTIHVAGTNGKGSTQAMIRAGIEAAGQTAHAYTSPHLARFHERIRVAGEIIKEDLLPKILDPAVVDYYTKDGGEYFDRPEGGFSVPREFAFAAVRVGHSMVRPGYRLQHEETVSLQQLVKASSSRRPTENTPEKWGIDWSLFFDIDGSADKPEINFARKFDFLSKPYKQRPYLNSF